MRDLVLLVVAGMLLGFLGGTTLVVVREGGERTGRISGVEALDSSAPEVRDEETTAEPEEMSPEPPPSAAAADSTELEEPAAPVLAAAEPTAVDDRGTPLREGHGVAAALPAMLPAGPMPGPEDLARYLSTMQPREAARVLERMTDAEIARILAMIGGRRASAIMGSLAPDRAAAIGRLALANQQEDVS